MKKAAQALLVGLFLVSAVFAADVKERWVYVAMNLVNDEDTDALVKLIGEAHAAGATHIQFNDYCSGMMGEMPPRYFANVARVKKAAKDAGVIIAPAICALGMSGRYLYNNPNLADGIPVRNMRFVVRNGAAVVDPSLKPTFTNPGLDGEDGGVPVGWKLDIGGALERAPGEAGKGSPAGDAKAALDAAAVSVGADTQIKHSGAASLKVSASGDVRRARGLHAGVSQLVKVRPFHTYKLSVWIKTDGITPEEHPFQIRGARDGRQLCYSYFMIDPAPCWPPSDMPSPVVQTPGPRSTWTIAGTDFGIKPTADWAQYKVAFNTLDYDEIELFAGATEISKGTIWYDDVEIEPAGLLNVLRRELTPLTVTSEDGKTAYIETVDFKRVEDPMLGVAPSRGDFSPVSRGTYDIWHQPPSIAITGDSRIKDGDVLLVSFYSPQIIYNKLAVTASMSDPATFDVMEQEMKWVARVWNSPCYMMNYDEIRSGGWEVQPGGAHLTPGQLLANHIKRAVEIAHKYAPGARLYVWSDMFDPNHNAGELKPGQYYYLVNGSWAGSWEGLPKEVVIYNWYGGQMDTLKWFAGRGHEQILSGWRPDRWAEYTEAAPGVVGLSYTTWDGNYSRMADYFSRVKQWMPAGEADKASVESTAGR